MVKVQKTDNILLLGTEEAFCPMATSVSKEYINHFGITQYKAIGPYGLLN